MFSLAFGTCPEKIPEEYRLRSTVSSPNNQADVSCNAVMMGVMDVLVATVLIIVTFYANSTGQAATYGVFAGIELYPLMHLAITGVKYLHKRCAGSEAAQSQQSPAQQRQGPESKSAV